MKKTIFGLSLKILVCSSLAICVLFMLPAFFFLNSLYNEVNRNNLADAAEALFQLSEDNLSDFFENRDQSGSDLTWLNSINEKTPFRITLIATDGQVLADSNLDYRFTMNHLGRSEVDGALGRTPGSALSGEPSSARRFSISLREEQIYYAIPVPAKGGGNPIGVFRVSRSVPGFMQRISSSALPFLVLALIIGGAACCMGYIFSRAISGAFNRLIAVTGEAASKPYLGRAIAFITETQEFTQVEASLRDMASEVSSRIEQAKIEGRRVEAIVNGMSEAVFAADSSLKLMLVNRQARSQFIIKDSSELSLLEATGSTELEEAAQKVMKSGVSLEFEMKWYRGGKQMSFNVFAAPFGISESRTPEGVVIVLNDITRLQRLEQVRKDFAANVSHELRTPIQVIKGFSETMLDSLNQGSTNTEQIISSVEMIAKNARTMENLTNDLLSLVSLEDKEGIRPEMTQVNVASLMKEAVQSVEIQQQKKNITIHQSCPAELMAKLHGHFIVQALTNLLDNGIKYSPSGSQIWFEAFMEEASGNGKELVFTVKDEGIGIPAEHQGRLFERFYRVDKARSREAGGTGLGLAIVRHIALIHNGKAEASSHAGEGSVFTIRIPQE